MGLIYKDGVIIAADQRATTESLIVDKGCLKIHYIAPNIYCCGAGTAAEQHTQEEADRQQSTELVTLQIYNETQKTWDTYQGTLDGECGLHGDWKYEIMGKELVLTGARLIGQIPEGE